MTAKSGGSGEKRSLAADAVVCFDLSETLVAWNAAYETSLREAMQEWVGRWGEEGEAGARIEAALRAFRDRRAKGHGKAAAIRAAAAVLQTIEDERTARQLAGASRRLAPAFAALVPEAEEALRALAGRHRLAIVTNLDAVTARALWSRLGLYKFIRESDIFVAANGLRKPQKRLFRAAAEKLGAPGERCVMVGDSYRRDVAGALRAGWHAVWIGGKKRRPRTGAPRSAAGARLSVVSSLKELPALFRSP